jgi:hypothetical protein
MIISVLNFIRKKLTTQSSGTYSESLKEFLKSKRSSSLKSTYKRRNTMKKNLPLFIVTLLAAFHLCLAQAEGAESKKDALAQKIIDNSRANWEAYKSRNVSALKEYTAEDYESYAVTGPSNRQQDIAGITDKSLTVEAYTIDDPKVTVATKDVAILRYKCDLKGTIQGKPLKPCYVTEVWVNRGGKWQIVSYQETPL